MVTESENGNGDCCCQRLKDMWYWCTVEKMGVNEKKMRKKVRKLNKMRMRKKDGIPEIVCSC